MTPPKRLKTLESSKVEEVAVLEAATLLRNQIYRLPFGQGASWKDTWLLPENEEQQRNLEKLLTQTLEHEMSNSALLLGPRGSGKTLVLQYTLKVLQEKFHDEFFQVHLNGILHSEEKAAFQEMARQLCSQASLPFSSKSTFDENLDFFSEMVKEASKCGKPTFFFLDEFDLFALRPQQNVLYNLLDSVQLAGSRSVIIGTSCRLDADQLLEKRVRSRFSHRKFVFFPLKKDDALKLFEVSLKLPEDFPHREYAEKYNKDLQVLLNDKKFDSAFDSLLSLDSSPQTILDLCFRALSAMDQDSGTIKYKDVIFAIQNNLARPKRHILEDLSVLELSLLVGMKRLRDKSMEEFNFEIVFDEYRKLKDEMQAVTDTYSRAMSLKAFERLLAKELVQFTKSRNSGCDILEFQMVELIIDQLELEQALEKNKACPQVLKQWFTKEKVSRVTQTN